MPRPLRLPRPDPQATGKSLDWPYSARPPETRMPPKVQRLAVAEVLPQLHIAHRLLGEVGVGYRIIFDHELIAVLVGEGDLYLDGVRYPVCAPCLVNIPPWVDHTLVTRSGPRGDQLAFHFDLAPGVPDRPRAGKRREPYRVEVLGAPALPPVQPLDSAVLAELAEALHAFRASASLAPLRAARALQGALLRVWTSAATTREGVGGDQGVIAALELIAERFAESLDVADLARAAGLGRSRFADRFQAWTGRSPAAFLRRYRIDRACGLLVAGAATLEEIAPQVGYGDAFALSKAFRAELGCSPRAWGEARSAALDGG